MAYLTARIVRITSVRLWVATEGHPAPRGLALLVVVALLAITGSQWLPDRQTESIQQAGPAAPSDRRTMSEGQVVKLQDAKGATLDSVPTATDGRPPRRRPG